MQIADSLRKQIEDGTYKPGDALPSLGKLAASFVVCRQTAQHAMLVLVGEGLVELVPRYGYYVCDPS
jgi:GntR family transcriptional regulator